MAGACLTRGWMWFTDTTLTKHSLCRNLSGWFTNRLTDLVLDKPPGFYLSSFRCVSAFVAREVAAMPGPYPYVDGLILQVTQNIGALEVRLDETRRPARAATRLRRLVRL